MAGARRKTTIEERREIVKYCIEHNRNYKETAGIYDVSYSHVYSWVKKYLYLSAILDLYDRYPVAYVIGARNDNRLVFKTFDKAMAANPNAKPLFHSDRGFQYTSRVFQGKLKEHEIEQSMSRVGHCTDNGPAEGFWGIIKSEMYQMYTITDEASLRFAISDYIRFYSEERPQDRYHCKTPSEVRREAFSAALPAEYLEKRPHITGGRSSALHFRYLICLLDRGHTRLSNSPAESREYPLLKKGNLDAFFREKCLTKNMRLSLRALDTDSTNNVIERLNREIRRPTRVVGCLSRWEFCPHAGLRTAPLCGWHLMGQQEVHEYETPGGCLGKG